MSLQHEFGNIDTITLIVGDAKIAFHVHEELLCEASSVFKAGFASKFKEGSEKTMKLPEDDIDTVDIFVQWLYRQQPSPSTIEIPSLDDVIGMQLMRLFVFADKYDVPNLKLSIYENIFTAAKSGLRLPHATAVEYVYSNTKMGSGIRAILVDVFVWRVEQSWFESPTVPSWLVKVPEFASDMVIAFAKLPDLSDTRRRGNPFTLKTSKHYDDLEKASKKSG
ncbi:hypothetical protein MMC28_004698 [Mycoblastus sanguinarius]|nr:hypothetical protein [Mycoblastus sanguinarius]